MLIRTRTLRLAIFAALGVPFGVLGSSCGADVAGGSNGGGGQATRSSGSTGGAGGGGGGGHGVAACTNAHPILTSHGVDTGYVKCSDGSINRVTPVACDDTVIACDGSEDTTTCASDADCPQAPKSRCGRITDNMDETTCGCISLCETDADCKSKETCFCAGIVDGIGYARCRPASCERPSDCSGGECGLSVYAGCQPEVSLACRDRVKDACRVDGDCASDEGCSSPYTPAGDPPAPWACGVEGCDGRLLRGARGLVSAEPELRADWAEGRKRGGDADLTPETRRALAEHWERVAATEHAAVASFARFSLQLLAAGAPPAFLEASQRAAAEEIEHARRAYAIASGFAGKDIGPGPLDACSIPLSGSRASLIESLIDDACVSELVNVTEVLAIASVATDAAVRAFAERTAEEEARHVALAWRVLRWALEGATEAERIEARRRLDARMASIARPLAVAIAAPAHGLLSAKDRVEIRRRALRDVAAPAIRALFAGLEAEASAPSRPTACAG